MPPGGRRVRSSRLLRLAAQLGGQLCAANRFEQAQPAVVCGASMATGDRSLVQELQSVQRALQGPLRRRRRLAHQPRARG